MEFYLFLWKQLDEMFHKSLLTSISLGELSIEQRRGIINIIPKPGKDARYIKNWWPITVLNVDYKVYAKSIANRLKPLLRYIICQDQTGYVQNRVIGENIRIIDDLMHFQK